MGVLSEMQHKDILFLFAISQELIVRAEKEGFSVSDYISKISKKDNVELRELTKEALASVSEFKFVIILAHHDYGTDSLLLGNGTYLPLNVLVSLLPNNLKGDVVLDFAVCRTHDDKKKVNLTDEIKKINAHYYVQTAEEETDLKTRLKVYRLLPTVLKVRPETNYHQAYLFCLYELKSRQQSGKVRPSTTKLGGTESSEDVKTSVYSPRYTVRGESFSILVAMHFDADNGTLFVSQRRNNMRLAGPEAEREHNVAINNLHYGDELSIKISFEDANDNPTEFIWVKNNNPQSVKISDKIVPLEFRVFVDAVYPSSCFKAILEYIKDRHCLMKFDNHIYEVESVYPQYYTKPERPPINITGDKTWQSLKPDRINSKKSKGRTSRAGEKVTKAFKYDNVHDKESANKRLVRLYQALLNLSWIREDTQQQTFIDLFSGGDCSHRIVWMDDVNTLAYLFRRLVSVEKFVAVQSPYGLWQMVDGHFWEKEGNKPFGNERLRKTHSPQEKSRHIDYLVNILNPKISEQQLMDMLMGEIPEKEEEST